MWREQLQTGQLSPAVLYCLFEGDKMTGDGLLAPVVCLMMDDGDFLVPILPQVKEDPRITAWKALTRLTQPMESPMRINQPELNKEEDKVPRCGQSLVSAG